MKSDNQRRINTDNLPKVFKDLDAINKKKKIKIRVREVKDKIYSLYLHAQYDGVQEQETLKLYIHGKINTKKQDEENFRLAIAIRDEKENKLIQNKYNFRLTDDAQKMIFLDYFNFVVGDKKNIDYNWINTHTYLTKFINGKKIQIKHIDEVFCEKFYSFLCDNLNKNTANIYFSKLKYVLTYAFNKNIIKSNLSRHVKIRNVPVEKVFLSVEEIKILESIECLSPQLKNAFLFSCWTGLRLSDIEKMRCDDIENGYLNFRQKKTKEFERIKLHGNAVKIIEIQKDYNKSNNSLVFRLSTRSTMQIHLRKWVNDAKLKKNVTFHSARHTFATLLLTYDVDIYTVSKLLGHKDIQTTQVYAKLIDLKKDEAVDKLPII